MVCNYACGSSDYEHSWWLGIDTDDTNDSPSIHCWEDARGMVMMKIDELAKEINSYFLNLKALKRDDGIVINSSNDNELLLVPEKATNFMDVYFYVGNQRMYFTKDNREKLSALIEEFLKTPVEERFPEKKYRVRLRGFNSDSGHQYLTVSTRYSTINLGSVFAAAWNTGLKQTFTADELNKIRERFKGSKWIASMLNDGVEEVGE